MSDSSSTSGGVIRHHFLDLGAANAPLRDRLVDAATRVIDSGRYIGGEEVGAFEAKLASATGTAHAVALSNGLDALRLSLRAFIELGRLTPGDGVIVQANAYIASVLAISDAGLRPVLVDVGRDFLPDHSEMIRAMSEASNRVRAFMPVHLYGTPVWTPEIAGIVESGGLIVIEDNAQAIGASAPLPGINGTRTTGSLGHVGAFSFYPTKNVGALGDAGAVTTNDSELAGAVRALANYGSDRRYHNIYAGFNCRMDPIQAAMLSVKLDFLEEESERRRQIASAYDDAITNPEVTRPRTAPGNVWHQYVILHPRRDDLKAHLLRCGIETDIHYATPPHRQPCYASSLPHGPLPSTELLADTMLSLPIGSNTSATDAREIAQAINSF